MILSSSFLPVHFHKYTSFIFYWTYIKIFEKLCDADQSKKIQKVKNQCEPLFSFEQATLQSLHVSVTLKTDSALSCIPAQLQPNNDNDTLSSWFSQHAKL